MALVAHGPSVIVCLVSDLHGHFPLLEGGDLLIVAGDLTARDQEEQYFDFWRWACYQNYKKIVVIAGNHDNFLLNHPDALQEAGETLCYLCDSGTEFGGLKIWGSPWTQTFRGMNPKCKAFTFDTDRQLAEKWELIPEDTDILVTHSPPYGMLDRVINGDKMRYCGSPSLQEKLLRIKNLKLHVFGHIHESHGQCYRAYISKTVQEDGEAIGPLFVNASYVNERYQPVNKPIRVIL